MSERPTMCDRYLAKLRSRPRELCPVPQRIYGWRWRTSPDLSAMQACLRDIVSLLEAMEDEGRLLAGPTGAVDSRPELPHYSNLSIAFNGWDHQAADPFRFPGWILRNGEPPANFCDTQAKAYDDAVVACLCIATMHFPAKVLHVWSDVEGKDALWGVMLFRSLFERSSYRPFWDDTTENAQVVTLDPQVESADGQA